MVIFHSYVKLPDGQQKMVTGNNQSLVDWSEKPGLIRETLTLDSCLFRLFAGDPDLFDIVRCKAVND